MIVNPYVIGRDGRLRQRAGCGNAKHDDEGKMETA
jgi:hypothetical protein